MKTTFMSREYIALALIKAKYQFLRENFITMSELNQFNHFLQMEFNDRELDVIINSDTLKKENFNIMGNVIMESNTCYLDLDFLPETLLNILYDNDLISSFLLNLENEKINNLEKSKSMLLNLQNI